ncbi:hypothetical protein LguiB_025855 [Lonicera macranthoides]
MYLLDHAMMVSELQVLVRVKMLYLSLRHLTAGIRKVTLSWSQTSYSDDEDLLCRVKANAGMLTNFEVLNFLQSRGAGKDPTRVIAPIAPSEFKVYDYLEQSAACNQSREKINEFVIIEECDRRIGDSVEELLEVVAQVLPPPPSQTESDEGVVEGEDGTTEMDGEDGTKEMEAS